MRLQNKHLGFVAQQRKVYVRQKGIPLEIDYMSSCVRLQNNLAIWELPYTETLWANVEDIPFNADSDIFTYVVHFS